MTYYGTLHMHFSLSEELWQRGAVYSVLAQDWGRNVAQSVFTPRDILTALESRQMSVDISKVFGHQYDAQDIFGGIIAVDDNGKPIATRFISVDNILDSFKGDEDKLYDFVRAAHIEMHKTKERDAGKLIDYFRWVKEISTPDFKEYDYVGAENA
jgi:hypothetical protein